MSKLSELVEELESPYLGVSAETPDDIDFEEDEPGDDDLLSDDDLGGDEDLDDDELGDDAEDETLEGLIA